MQYDASMAIVVSNPVRRPPCCGNRNVRYSSQGTHRDIDDTQFDFMLGRDTTDAIFIVR